MDTLCALIREKSVRLINHDAPDHVGFELAELDQFVDASGGTYNDVGFGFEFFDLSFDQCAPDQQEGA
jgi:hypothetical protein